MVKQADNDITQEQLSALFDGELSEQEFNDLLRELEIDETLVKKWQGYQLASDSIRRSADVEHQASSQFVLNVIDAIDKEPAYSNVAHAGFTPQAEPETETDSIAKASTQAEAISETASNVSDMSMMRRRKKRVGVRERVKPVIGFALAASLVGVSLILVAPSFFKGQPEPLEGQEGNVVFLETSAPELRSPAEKQLKKTPEDEQDEEKTM